MRSTIVRCHSERGEGRCCWINRERLCGNWHLHMQEATGHLLPVYCQTMYPDTRVFAQVRPWGLLMHERNAVSSAMLRPGTAQGA